MDHNKKIIFILPTLFAGGAERVVSFIAQNIDANKFSSLLLITGKKKDAAFSVQNIQVKFLEKKRVLNSIVKIILFLRKNKPDIVFSSIGHLNTIMGLLSPFFPNIKFVVRVATLSSKINQTNSSKSLFKLIRLQLAGISYKLVDKIIFQSQDMAEDVVNRYKIFQ